MHTDGFDAGPSRMIAFWRHLERRVPGPLFLCVFFELKQQDGARVKKGFQLGYIDGENLPRTHIGIISL